MVAPCRRVPMDHGAAALRWQLTVQRLTRVRARFTSRQSPTENSRGIHPSPRLLTTHHFTIFPRKLSSSPNLTKIAVVCPIGERSISMGEYKLHAGQVIYPYPQPHILCRFNRVFTPDSTQNEVWLATEPLVQSALDGMAVTCFAYGQTGSGMLNTTENCSLNGASSLTLTHSTLREDAHYDRRSGESRPHSSLG